MVLLGKRWQLPVSSLIILLLIPTEANSQRSEGWGFERRSGHRSRGRRTTRISCVGHPPTLLQHVFLFYFGSGQEVSVVVRGDLSLQSPWGKMVNRT